MLEYSAGFTKEGWFEQEMRTILQLKQQGFEKKELLEQVIERNLFQMRSVSGIETRFKMVYRRSETFSDELRNIFLSGSIYDIKALLLYSYLKVYRVPYEFFMEVIITNYQNNKLQFLRSEFEYFFEKKESESEKVRAWRPETKKRLTTSMLLFLRKSGLIHEKGKGVYEITPLHMSQIVKEYASENDTLLLKMANLK